MAYQTKKGVRFLSEKCTLMKDGKTYFHNATGKIIQTLIIGRSVHYTEGGYGDVARVHHLYITTKPDISLGDPIQAGELIGWY